MAHRLELETESLKPMGPEEGLQFLVRLANTNIDELKRMRDDPEGLPTIIYGLYRYFEVMEGEIKIRGALEKAREHPDDLKKPIADLKRLLDALAEGNLDDTSCLQVAPRSLRFVLKEGELMSLQDGDLGEAIIDGAHGDLDGTKHELLRLGHCQRTGCGKLFYKTKLNQLHCDHRCANKAAAARRAERIKAKARKAKPSRQYRARS